MIDAREPKNGDFASYVEELSKMPVGQVLTARPDDAHARAEPRRVPVVRDAESAKQALQELLKARRSGGAAAPGGPGAAAPAGHEFAHQISKVLSRVAALATLAGIALVAISFTDEPPFFADPVLGIGLVVMGAVANRLSRKLA